MDTADAFLDLGLAVGLGLLVGMQRERTNSTIAGVRTFSLITLLGAVAALLANVVGVWIIAVALAGVIAFAIAANFIASTQARHDSGITTEIAIVLMYCVGVMLVHLPREIPVIITGVATILLQLKTPLRGIIERFSDQDIRAIMTFVLITLVILPVLPNKSFGPYDALNPHEIWRMVVLVVGISLAGYVAIRALGERASIAVGGMLGGLVSSTATTVAFSRRAHDSRAYGAAAAVIIIAGSVVYPRLLIEIQIVAPTVLLSALGPLLILFGVSVVLATFAYFTSQPQRDPIAAPSNPTELKSALFFGGLYAIVVVAVAAGRDFFGDRGIFAIAAISGLTDMDAITLSTARLAGSSELAHDTAWRVILVAAISNLLFKSLLVLGAGGVRLFMRVAPLFAIKIAVAVALIAWWS